MCMMMKTTKMMLKFMLVNCNCSCKNTCSLVTPSAGPGQARLKLYRAGPGQKLGQKNGLGGKFSAHAVL